MSSLSSRLAQLEKNAPATIKQYLCIIHPDDEGKGYDVFPMEARFQPGQKRDGLHFATMAELETFEARPDVDLLTVRIVYASEVKPNEHG